ncbi:hypothetical protein JYT50_01475, partial [bacterium AH-315-A23]|nr:hypothetical protein [bacterium AH-315-A23]
MTQGICNSTNATGEITIIENDDLQLISQVGSDNQYFCVNSQLPINITYGSSSLSSLVLTGLLPAGLNFNFDAITKIGTISGTATVSGTFSYSITTSNNCSSIIDGVITVEAEQFITHI